MKKTLFVGHGKRHGTVITFNVPNDLGNIVYLDINPKADPDIIGDFTDINFIKSLGTFNWDYILMKGPPYILIPIFIKHSRLLLKNNGLLIIKGLIRGGLNRSYIDNFIKPLSFINGYSWYYVVDNTITVYKPNNDITNDMKNGLLFNTGRLFNNYINILPEINDNIYWECASEKSNEMPDFIADNKIHLIWKRYNYIYGQFNNLEKFIGLLIHLKINGFLIILNGLANKYYRPDIITGPINTQDKTSWVFKEITKEEFVIFFRYYIDEGIINIMFEENNVIIKKIKAYPKEENSLIKSK